MITKLLDEEAIFKVACQISSPAARTDYLKQVCDDDPPTLERIQALLRVHDEESRFLISPPPGIPATLDTTLTKESVGSQIGPYKLCEQIGEGGMGTVWMAQQSEPVKRLVALKLIKPGMDSRQVIARFEVERQALALMDHPNIARVLDGGATSNERPYFVMDLVRGVPITRYCDEHHLTPRQRLELLVPVCHAIQHAHQKGIIHRDLKPSNVLVALYDGKPVPKVIDFGVAKATGPQLTEQTLVTGFGAIVGTLEYMSPEQAEINQLDIDTRSDIYSLGVLLYELLTGSPPFSSKELEKAGLLEMLRVIRETEPSKPSTKLSSTKGLPALAANRGIEPAKLTKLVRGELDWIVMKTLEKDRNRRYETAAGLAQDLQRYLADEPVAACPPSLGYRLRKVLRRHRRLAASAVVVAVLVVAAGLLAYRSHRLEVQRLAEQRHHDEQLLFEKRKSALEKATLVAMSGDLEAADEAIGDAELLGASAGQVRLLRGLVAVYSQDPHQAIGHLNQAVRLMPDSVAARALLAQAYFHDWQSERHTEVLKELELLTPATPEDHLFKLHAEAFTDPQRALKGLEAATERRDSRTFHTTIAQVIRASVRNRVAMSTRDPAVSELAMKEVVVTKAMMPLSPQPLWASINIHLVAAGLFAEAGHDDKRQAALAQAERDAQALERFGSLPAAVLGRFFYLDHVGQDAAAFDVLRLSAEQTESHILAYLFACALYRRGEYQNALDFLDRHMRERPGVVSRGPVWCYVLAELPDGPARALEAYREAAAAPLDMGLQYTMTVPFLLGRKGEILPAAQTLRRSLAQRSTPQSVWWDRLLDYDFGLISADELLQAAPVVPARSAAHYRIAFHRLAEGDRAGARDHFRQVVGTNIYLNLSHHWARAFLERMEQDPAWPPWIPLKE